MDIDIKKIAALSKLVISEEQQGKMQSELFDIIKMCENLPEIEEDFVLNSQNKMQLREDVVHPSFNRELLLANAPETVAGCIYVKR